MEKTLFEKKKLLVEFMGLKPNKFGNDYSWADSPFYHCAGGDYNYVMDNIIKYAPYNTDWNWLMGVVNKISDLEHWSLNGVIDHLNEKFELDGIYTITDMFEAVVMYVENLVCKQEEN